MKNENTIEEQLGDRWTIVAVALAFLLNFIYPGSETTQSNISPYSVIETYQDH